MSQDLFAAFGDVKPLGSIDATAPIVLTTRAGDSLTIVGQSGGDLEEDDFGDFQDAGTTTTVTSHEVTEIDTPQAVEPVNTKQETKKPVSPTKTKLPFEVQEPKDSRIGRHPFADHMDILFQVDENEYSAGQDEWNDLSNDPEAAMAYSKRVVQEQLDAEAKAIPSTTRNKHIATQNAAKNLDVLFDIDNLSEEEEDEENAIAEHDDWGDFETTETNQIPVVAHQSKPALDLLGLEESLPRLTKTTDNHSQKTQPLSLQASALQDDPWDDFDGSDPVHVTSTSGIISTITSTPTNIPPPSMLLSLLASSLKVLPTPETIPGLLSTLWIIAHILAGRKLRWKRSSSLAASMRIGPAMAGKGGMKLTGIDRGENIKEEREVAELLTVWKSRVGKLRSASHTSKIIDLHEVMPIKTLKALDGGFTAPHECALCGLKREERVLKVDEDVLDAFGEFWNEAINMHTNCISWWTKNESSLRSR